MTVPSLYQEPYRDLCDGVKLKSKLCWRHQIMLDMTAMENIPRGNIHRKYDQPKTDKYVTGGKVQSVESSKPSEISK